MTVPSHRNRLVILTGASGSGKTAIVDEIRRRPGLRADLALIGFDSLGVPSEQAMIRDHGSSQEWQRVTTERWMALLKERDLPQRPVLFEGQMRISLIEDTLAKYEISHFQILLIDCDNATRARRLVDLRGQPHLNNPQMMNWAHYLRSEALSRGIPIVDTTAQALSDSATLILNLFEEQDLK